MRPALLSLGIVVLLAAACEKELPPVPDGPALPVPQCRTVREYDQDSFARMLSAMDRAGDVKAVTAHFLKHRPAVDALLAKRDAALLQRLKPALDAHFSEERLRTRTACAFAALSNNKAGVAALEAWSRDPRMHAINKAIWSRTPVTSTEEETYPLTPERKALLRKIGDAMALRQTQGSITEMERDLPAILSTALDVNPASQVQQHTPTADAIVETWLAPLMAKVRDKDLVAYLGFANSRFAGDYYIALGSGYDFQTGEWFAQLADILRPYQVTAGAEAAGGVEALVADARHSLHVVGMPAASADAMAKLLQAQRLAPADPEIFTLLGEAALQTAAPMPLGQDQIRAVIESPNYADAERFLSKAIELAPEDASALMLRGRLHYLQGQDDDAMRLYDLARAVNAAHPSVDHYVGDVFVAKQDYAKAVRYYQAALSKPEGIVHTHVNVVRNLLVALRRSGRQSEYAGIVEGYLKRNPEAWNVRFELAEYLLASDVPAAKVLAVIEPIPDALLPARKIPTLSAALFRQAEERLSRPGPGKTVLKTGPGPQSVALIRRAIAINPDVRSLAEALCRSGAREVIAVATLESTASPKPLATALVVCSLRWNRNRILQQVADQAQVPALSAPHPDLYGETPLCYAAATRNVLAFTVLAKMQVSPSQKCRDGTTVAERLQAMGSGSSGRQQEATRMKSIMNTYYRR